LDTEKWWTLDEKHRTSTATENNLTVRSSLD
jgi:hypothetical protein